MGSAEGVRLERQDYLGAVDFEVSELARAPNRRLFKPLGDRAGARGSVTVTADEVVAFKKDLEVTVCGVGLANKDG